MGVRLVPKTVNPCAASSSAVACPMPDDAPVTRATCLCDAMVLFLSEAIAHDRWRLCLNDCSNINSKKLVENRYCRLDDIFEHAPILLATGKHTKADKGSQQEMR